MMPSKLEQRELMVSALLLRMRRSALRFTRFAIAQAQQQAIQKVSEDAKKQADATLSALNLKSKEVISIQINDTQPPQSVVYPSALVRQQAKVIANTPVVAGEQKVQQTVTRCIPESSVSLDRR